MPLDGFRDSLQGLYLWWGERNTWTVSYGLGPSFVQLNNKRIVTSLRISKGNTLILLYNTSDKDDDDDDDDNNNNNNNNN